MNILFLIGNGFDLNLNLKTGYKDFYKHYKSLSTDSENIHKLKDEISGNSNNWSDLELALGEYTDKLGSIEAFDEVFDDLSEKLAEYLESQEEKFDNTNIDKDRFFDNLGYPEKALIQGDLNQINNFKNKWRNDNWNINIITFNYTRTIEKILGIQISKIKVGAYHRSTIILNSVEHIHGFTQERMAMGVNDITQVKNKAFHDNDNIIETIVKPKYNQAIKHTIDDVCIQKVREANLICLFGSSIGETDNMWWELIGEQLHKDCQLIIFHKCKSTNPRIAQKEIRIEKEVRNKFLSKTKLTDEEKNKLGGKVFVGVNKDIFNLLNK